jgi:hypothetical protein
VIKSDNKHNFVIKHFSMSSEDHVCQLPTQECEGQKTVVCMPVPHEFQKKEKVGKVERYPDSGIFLEIIRIEEGFVLCLIFIVEEGGKIFH